MFIICTAWIRPFLLKRRLGQSLSWYSSVRSGILDFLKSQCRRSSGRRRFTQLQPCKRNFRFGREDLRMLLLPTLRDLGIALVAYSPLGRGFLAGRIRTLDDLAANDWQRNNPRFQGENFTKNLAIADRIRNIAGQKNCTPGQLALAWLLRKPEVSPIPDTSSLARLGKECTCSRRRTIG